MHHATLPLHAHNSRWKSWKWSTAKCNGNDIRFHHSLHCVAIVEEKIQQHPDRVFTRRIYGVFVLSFYERWTNGKGEVHFISIFFSNGQTTLKISIASTTFFPLFLSPFLSVPSFPRETDDFVIFQVFMTWIVEISCSKTMKSTWKLGVFSLKCMN